MSIYFLKIINSRFSNGSAPLYTNFSPCSTDASMANHSLVTMAKPVNQNNFNDASKMNGSNSSFIINQPFSIHYTGQQPVTIQAVMPQFYIYLPTQLNATENQYLLINTPDQIPMPSNNMQVSSLYDGTADNTMAFQTTNACTYRIPFR